MLLTYDQRIELEPRPSRFCRSTLPRWPIV